MAELDIGQHCQVEHCRQRDFLPFVCDACSGIFCASSIVPEPCVGRPPTTVGSPAVRSASSSHSPPHPLSVCSLHGGPALASVVTAVSEKPKSDTHATYPCSAEGCTQRELVAVLCPHCEKNFCLRHRHQSDHGCEKLETPQPRMAATQKLVKDIIDSKTGHTANRRRKGAKNSATAAKVALMQLKMHADGDAAVPQTERTYFRVFLPKGSKEKSKPMFFCHRWSIGKVIDSAAALASLRNDNNRLTAKKLRLCHMTSGEALPLDHTLETCIAKEDCPLYNGGNIILEYLNDEEQFLKNVDSYFE